MPRVEARAAPDANISDSALASRERNDVDRAARFKTSFPDRHFELLCGGELAPRVRQEQCERAGACRPQRRHFVRDGLERHPRVEGHLRRRRAVVAQDAELRDAGSAERAVVVVA
eukprot:CAMPEP_0119377878 /NCGR_PEP_ID=MMETSP1334-20130426/47080_1 /TAXON_ID=127549 /ORGANISM="Calcidiscus leptoporus, Strain RCC1130" /LENGTH=114 /DNA_ID=CAMNT_0007396929 /DNA_START=125 /DNA_END=466 /DNA_ORIENTATION=+